MEESKTKVYLLGMDGGLLKKVSERINKTRPAQVHYYTDLKMFLETCIQDPPDFVGVSVTYPHKSVAQFPRIFKMALNLPVLTYGEAQDIKTRKALSSSMADMKISGVITGHNLWMKIVNFQKMMSDSSSETSGSDKVSSEDNKKRSSVFLQGSSEKSIKTQNNNLLSNLFAALEDPDSVDGKSGLNLISSGESTKYKKKEMNHLASSEDELKKASSMSHLSGSESSMKSSGGDSTENSQRANQLSNLMEDLLGDDSQSSEDTSNQLTHTKGGKETAPLATGADQSQLESKADQQDKNNMDSVNPLHADSKDKAGSSKDQQDRDLKPNLGSQESQSGSESPLEEGGPGNHLDLRDPLGKNAVSKDSQDTQMSDDHYGKVQLSDEKELKEQAKKKNKEKQEQAELKQKNILMEASERGLEGGLFAQKNNEPNPFTSTRLYVYTINMGRFKGYLTLANGQNRALGDNELESFKVKLLESLKENGAHGELSHPYALKPNVAHYNQVIQEFSEFNITHRDQEGTDYNVAFVKREVLFPKLEESDKPDMYLVDIKTIPPQTPVNFDAYLYLPKNKRFVRYLKDGRSLSLKQAKRHTEEEDGQGKFYLPKDQKENFFQFFIQNTLNWEFALHKKADDKAA